MIIGIGIKIIHNSIYFLLQNVYIFCCNNFIKNYTIAYFTRLYKVNHYIGNYYKRYYGLQKIQFWK